MDDQTELFLSWARRHMLIFGFWLPPNNFRWLYNFLTSLSFLLVYSFITFLVIHVVHVWGDIDDVSESLYMVFAQSSVAFKMTLYYYNLDKMIELFGFMNIETFKARSKRQEEILSFQARRTNRICMFFMCLVCTTCILWAVKPLLDKKDQHVLPFKIWLPIATDRSPNYELAFVYLNLTLLVAGLLFNGIDNVPLSMIMFACGQLEIVMNKISEIPDCSESSSSDNDKAYEQLTDCIYHHKTIIRFIRRVERVYHMNIFYHVCASVGIICLIGFRISIMDPYSLPFISAVTFAQAMLLQIYSYSWCGDKLTNASEDLRDTLYNCPWYSQNKRFNKALWVAMERMKKPIIFRIGNLTDLSFRTFVGILRSSYSYFAVLKQVRDK